jgi:NAD-dependent deacetylase
MSDLSQEQREQIRLLAPRLKQARRVLFITGAGLSADSGLPTYRGVGGLYNTDSTEEGLPIEVLLSGQMLQEDPATCWRYIAQIEEACRGAEPSSGHRFMAWLEQQREGVLVLTQNVDGLHRSAGSKSLIEIHGTIHRLFCRGCDWTEQVADYSELDIPPACPSCGELVRPDVVLFGEMLPPRAVRWLHAELEQGFDLVFSVGTTSVFPYIAEPVRRTNWAGGLTVEINPGDSAVSGVVHHRIQARGAPVLEALKEELLALE